MDISGYEYTLTACEGRGLKVKFFIFILLLPGSSEGTLAASPHFFFLRRNRLPLI